MGSGVPESAEFISKNAKHVRLASDDTFVKAGKSFAELYTSGKFALTLWKDDNPLNPQKADSDALAWIFVVDTLNFSFFSETNELFTVLHQGKEYNGYWSLCAAINRAVEEGIPILSPKYLKDITDEQVLHIFRSCNETTVPLLQKRIENLRELGAVVIEKFDGSFENVVRAANRSAVTFIDIVSKNFTSYNDIAQYAGRTVKIFKRVQILVADIWACFEGVGFGEFQDMDDITMFADYRVPQILCGLGLLIYDEELMARLESDPALPPGSELEVEIRGCSIHCVEVLKCHTIKALSTMRVEMKSDTPLNAVLLDFYLWGEAKQRTADLAAIPIHKTRTIFY